MSVMPIAPSAHGVPEDAYAAEVWDDESPATTSTGGEEGGEAGGALDDPLAVEQRGGDALAQTGHDTTGNENVFGHEGRSHCGCCGKFQS